MRMIEGSGTSNGVNYAYCLRSDSPWFGIYECRVHRYLLDSPKAGFCSEEFQIGEHKWKTKMKHQASGDLSVFLHSQNQLPVSVHFSIAVINLADAKKTRLLGDSVLLRPGGDSGFSKQLAIADIRDKSSGFLTSDIFTVEVTVRIKTEENESFITSTANNSATCTWTMKGLSDKSPFKLLSPEFKIGQLKWELELYLRGVKADCEEMALCLVSHNHSTIQTRVRFCAINVSVEKSVTKNFVHTFIQSNTSQGFPEFLTARALEDETLGFLEDEWITLTAQISIAGQLPMANPQAATPTQRQDNDETPKCVFCLVKDQTAGVLHGNKTHKCYCSDCAKFLAGQPGNINCPICREKVDVIIEEMF